MKLAGEHESVHEHEHDDEPVKELRLDHLVDLPPGHVILVLEPLVELSARLAPHLLLGVLALAVRVVALLAVVALGELVLTAVLFVVFGRVYLGLSNPQDVVLVGVLDLTLLLELLQVASLFSFLSLLGELSAQYTEYEIHDEERADNDQRYEVDVWPRAAFSVVNLFEKKKSILRF